MRVCVVGGGGREHALAHALGRTAEAVVTPGNPVIPGPVVTPPEAVEAQVEAAQRAGFDMHVHVDGDGSVRVVLDAIERITALLSQHFPASGDNPNELDDAPTVL